MVRRDCRRCDELSHPARTWRPLQDTADSAPFLYLAGGGWSGARRQTAGLPAFYNEGTLIWLDADVTIRRLTNGRKSLDDFCVSFLGQNDNGAVWVRPYEAADVYRELNAVAAYDWQAFSERRLRSKSADLPLDGVTNGGYTLVYTDTPNMFTDPWALDGSLNALGSLGVHITSDGTVGDAWPGGPAFEAGVSTGMKIVAVNGRRFSVDEMTRALTGSQTATTPLELIVESTSYFRVVSVG